MKYLKYFWCEKSFPLFYQQPKFCLPRLSVLKKHFVGLSWCKILQLPEYLKPY